MTNEIEMLVRCQSHEPMWSWVEEKRKVKPEFLTILKKLYVSNSTGKELAKELSWDGRTTAGIISSMEYYGLVRKVGGYRKQSPIWMITERGEQNLKVLNNNDSGDKCQWCGSTNGKWTSIYDWHCNDCGKVTID